MTMTNKGDKLDNMGDIAKQLFGRRDCARIAKAIGKCDLRAAVAIVTKALALEDTDERPRIGRNGRGEKA